ncbi:MAG: hypothetical protein QXN37_02350 [Candidatus Anstonellaceae archaeon]
MTRGLFTFFVASIFLFTLLSFASLSLQAKKPAFSVEKYKLVELEAFAIRKAIYAAASEAAEKGILISFAARTDSYAEAKKQVHQALINLEQEIIQAGFSVKLWCGQPSFDEIRLVSEEMESLKEPVLPKSTHHISSSECLKSIYIDLSQQSIHLPSIGFSIFVEHLGQGAAFRLPEEEVSFNAANISWPILN